MNAFDYSFSLTMGSGHVKELMNPDCLPLIFTRVSRVYYGAKQEKY